MKKLLIALAALMVTVAAYGQGEVVFNTKVTGAVDAKVTFSDGSAVGAGYTAQLFGGPAGTAVSGLTALSPTTTFRASGAGMGYVVPAASNVIVPGVASGASATIVMRAFNGADFASSTLKGESAPITITLGGGINPPANLTGLQGFVIPIPEPSTIALGVLGAGLLLFRRRK